MNRLGNNNNNNKTIRVFMQKMNFSRNQQGYEKLQSYFFKRLEPMYRRINKRVIIWDELFLAQKEYIVKINNLKVVTKSLIIYYHLG
jgi:N-acetyl-beta-hexosaminidase